MYLATSTTVASLQSQQYMLWQMVEQKKQENGVTRKMIETAGRMAALDRTLEVQVSSFLSTVRYVRSYCHGNPLNFDVAHLTSNPFHLGFCVFLQSCNRFCLVVAVHEVHSNNSFVDISSLSPLSHAAKVCV